MSPNRPLLFDRDRGGLTWLGIVVYTLTWFVGTTLIYVGAYLLIYREWPTWN